MIRNRSEVSEVLAIDPGTTQSAFIYFYGHCIGEMGIVENDVLLFKLSFAVADHPMVIEQIRSYPDTVFWSGRFWEAWRGERFLLPRLEVKKHLCHNGHAKDANVRQALIDRFGKPGTKKAPGLLYGVKKDIWAALGLAVCFWDRRCEI